MNILPCTCSIQLRVLPAGKKTPRPTPKTESFDGYDMGAGICNDL